MSRWYRAYEGTVTDAKLAEVALCADVSRSVAIACWHAILENAATVNDGGRIDIPPRRAAAILCEAPQLIEKVFAEFRAIGLLDDTGVVSWKRHSSRFKDDRPIASDWATIRSRVFARDDFTCTYCGAKGVKIECDHIQPVSRGGGHDDSNLTTACRKCNRSKRAKTLAEWLA